MNIEKKPDLPAQTGEIIPQTQIIPEEKKVPIEVINSTIEHLDDDWENDIGKPYIKPGSGPENPQ